MSPSIFTYMISGTSEEWTPRSSSYLEVEEHASSTMGSTAVESSWGSIFTLEMSISEEWRSENSPFLEVEEHALSTLQSTVVEVIDECSWGYTGSSQAEFQEFLCV